MHVVVRRAERCIGLAIRKGQAEGRIKSVGDHRSKAVLAKNRVSPKAFLPSGDATTDTYAMTDSITDTQFDEAIETAKAENVQRLDLDSYEASKERMREIEAAETVPDDGTVSRGSRGPTADPKSDKSISKKTGIPRSTIQETRKHVSVADEFPALQKPDPVHSSPDPF